MVCLYCGGKTQVSNSRLQKRNNSVWRRRSCLDCLATVTTLEKIEPGSAILVTDKKHSEPFLREKLFISIYDSCKHRKTALADAVGLTDTVINHLYPHIHEASISKQVISKETIKVLERFDKAAAVYFSSYHPVKG